MKADAFTSQKQAQIVSCAVLKLENFADQKPTSRALPVRCMSQGTVRQIEGSGHGTATGCWNAEMLQRSLRS
jgi:hypothetical protein